MAQWLIEQALLERLELEDALARHREAAEAEQAAAIEGSLKRREQAELALQRQAAV